MKLSCLVRVGALAATVALAACGGSSMPRASNDAIQVPSALKNNKVFDYTGKQQTFVVPAGVTRLSVIARGAWGVGDASSAAYPGRVYALIRVHPGDKLQVFVGGAGFQQTGGFNGGGSGGSAGSGSGGVGYGGGGASDVRIGGDALKDRIVVAAGGGGAGNGVVSLSLAVALLSACGGASVPMAGIGNATTGAAPKSKKTFHYTGKEQVFTVPAGVTRLTVVARGGEGGGNVYYGSSDDPGLPARVLAIIHVQPKDKLYVFVGGSGAHGGFNGGGVGGSEEKYKGNGGGGASDVRAGGDALTDRIIVAAGGGGAGGAVDDYGSAYGGNGGGLSGKSGGGGGQELNGQGGGGGTQSSGGTGGTGGISSSSQRAEPAALEH